MLDVFLLSVVILSNLVLGVIVYFNNPTAKINRVLSLFIFFVIIWTCATFLEDEVTNASSILLLGKIDFSAALLLSYFFLNFALLFSSRNSWLLRFSQLPLFIISSIYILIITSTNLVIENVEFFGNNFHFVSGPLEIVYDLTLISLFLTGIIILVQKYRKSAGIAKAQSFYVLTGFFLSIFIAVSTSLVLPNFFPNNPPIVARLGIYSILFLTSLTTYAIVRHRLLDIQVIIRRSLIYSVLLVVLIGLYTLLVFSLNRIFLPTGADTWPRFTDLIAIIIVAFTVDPLKRIIERATDRIFFKARYNAEETISKLSETLASVIELPLLVSEIKKVLHDTLKVSKIAIYTKADSHYKPLAEANDFPKKLDLSVEKEYFLASSFAAHRKEILVLDEIKRLIQEGKKLDPELVESAKFLADNGVAVIVPLLVKNNLSGAMFLGEKLSQDIYSGEDIRFLEILAHQAALALENAKLYEEERLYGIHLKQEVEKATADLRNANERLKELDKLKDEFMSIASHELRTPMTAIKSYVWLALNNRGGEISAKLRDYLTKVYDSSERMINMINDMLNVSRIETGRLQLEILPTSIPKVLEMVVGDLSARAAEAGVEIKVTKDQIVPLVLADKDKLAEIFTNLIGNALKFTPKGGSVTIWSRKKNGMVETSVADTGIGIAKENIGKLFKKYGRLGESYATVSPSTGTGLGLYITKQYLEKMNGSIKVESTPGKGSTFTFSLPIAQGVAKEAEETSEASTFVPKRIIT